MTDLTAKPLDIEAIDLVLTHSRANLLVRIGGRQDTLQPRIERLRGLLSGGDVMTGSVEQMAWRRAGEMQWAMDQGALVKTPLNARHVTALDERLAELGLLRRYSVAGNAAWIALPQSSQLSALDNALSELNLAGVVVRGPAGRLLLGVRSGDPFYRRVKQALDPDGRFGDL